VDKGSTGRVALLSIRPEYAQAIFEGVKDVEFRRSRLAPDVSIVIVYVTRPVAKVIGWFEVEAVIEGTPLALWRRFAKSAGIDRSAYLDYFDQAPRAFGIKVGRPTRLKRPKPLSALGSDLRPPQSFQYLPAAKATKRLAAWA
jgi:predicted transcriptional regulator